MRRGKRGYTYARLRTPIVISLLLTLYFTCFSCISFAQGRYDTLVSTTSQTSSTSSSTSTAQTIESSPESLKEEIDLNRFNNEFIDTAIFIIGILAGLFMMLEIAAFCATRVFPSLNRIVEKLSFLGIDGFDKGFIVPTIKILLLGLLSYFCVSGLLKQAIAYILGWFVVIFQGG